MSLHTRRSTRSVRLRSTEVVAFAAVAWFASGCATYSEQLRSARTAADGADYATAIVELDRVAGDPSADDIAGDTSGALSLALLERGILQQAQADWQASRADLSAADEHLEWLDLTVDPVGSLGKYLYSDSSGTYRPAPSEKLALNAFNLLNFLALGDLNGAAVEARRFTVMREALDAAGIEARSALGAYLAGYVFERRGEGDRALRYYEEALAAGASLQALTETVERLGAVFPYRGPNLKKILDGRDSHSARRVDPPTEILVVLATGRVPYKIPERVPVGAAIGYAGALFTGDAAWLGRGAAKVLVYPKLTEGRDGNIVRSVRVEGAAVEAARVDNLAVEVRREYEAMKPQIFAAALVRLAARAAVAEGIRAAARDQPGWVGILGSLAAEAALVAFDEPDTRSWTLLPSVVSVARHAVTAGTHEVEVQLEGEAARRVSVQVEEGGFALVLVTAPR